MIEPIANLFPAFIDAPSAQQRAFRESITSAKLPKEVGLNSQRQSQVLHVASRYCALTARRRSRSEAPTWTRRGVALTQRFSPTDQYCKARGATCIFTMRVSPGPSVTRVNAASVRGANCAPFGAGFGASRYTCGTSSPATLPVFRIFTKTSKPPSGADVAVRSVYLNVVYDRPNPNGKSG